MSKFGRKLIGWILLVIIGLGGISLMINNQFIERYYLKMKKNELSTAYEKVMETPIQELHETIQKLNQEDSIWIIELPWKEDVDQLNDQIIRGLDNEGIRIKKFWLWDGDVERLENGEVVNQLYNQGKLGYSVLIKFSMKENDLLMFCSMIPHVTPIIEMINVFSIAVWLGFVVVMSFVILFFVRRITKPLMQIKHVADEIAHLQFTRLDIHTGDELESVAASINQMSENLQSSHQQLEYKHTAMKRLLSDVSHELKTPIALIKAYGAGIEDELDDGTFLDTILEQNEIMSQMVEKLLGLSRLENQVTKKESIQMADLIKDLVDRQKLYIREQHITLELALDQSIMIQMDPEVMGSVLTNFITNAIKYTANKYIKITLYKVDGNVHFEIRNGIKEAMSRDISHLWEPFYVGEQSRNKNLSGSGLGLYIVHSLLEKYDINHGCHIEGGEIVFECVFP